MSDKGRMTDQRIQSKAAAIRVYEEKWSGDPSVTRLNGFVNGYDVGYDDGLAAQGPQCEWHEEDEDSQCYATTCNQAFQFDSDCDCGPSENGFKFCCFCGSTLIEVRYQRDDDDEPEAEK
jgi:hypothetical protein